MAAVGGFFSFYMAYNNLKEMGVYCFAHVSRSVCQLFFSLLVYGDSNLAEDGIDYLKLSLIENVTGPVIILCYQTKVWTTKE